MTSQVEQAVDRFSHSRACIRLAVHEIHKERMKGNLNFYAEHQNCNIYLGPTYKEIRKWIRLNRGFTVENVGGRCREFFTDKALLRTEEKRPNGTIVVHVYPVKEEKQP